MKNKTLLLLLLLTSWAGFAQQEITWQDLADVTFERRYYPDYDEYFLYPNFGDSVEALEGKEIIIKGFFLDIDPGGNIYVLSQGPMASCFFCGVGGPETAMELQFEQSPSFKMDDIVEVTGTLTLNADNVDHFNYILKGATAKLANQ